MYYTVVTERSKVQDIVVMLKQENFYTYAGFHMLFYIICEWYCGLYCLASKRNVTSHGKTYTNVLTLNGQN